MIDQGPDFLQSDFRKVVTIAQVLNGAVEMFVLLLPPIYALQIVAELARNGTSVAIPECSIRTSGTQEESSHGYSIVAGRRSSKLLELFQIELAGTQDFEQQAGSDCLTGVHWHYGLSPVGMLQEVVAAFNAGDHKTRLAERRDDLLG
jgi:hypothetical protein